MCRARGIDHAYGLSGMAAAAVAIERALWPCATSERPEQNLPEMSAGLPGYVLYLTPALWFSVFRVLRRDCPCRRVCHY
jgi:hypothetical protein